MKNIDIKSLIIGALFTSTFSGCSPNSDDDSSAKSSDTSTSNTAAEGIVDAMANSSVESPIVLAVGTTSRQHKIATPNVLAYFQFTTTVAGIYNITTLSSPETVDQAWILTEGKFESESQRCDFDKPSRGHESCDTSLPLEANKTYYLAIVNFTGDEPGERAEEVVFTITIAAKRK